MQPAVLLVEDDDAVREVLCRMLSREGYDVVAAEDGEAALVVAESYPHRLHAVVTDVVMPRMGGVDLVERLQASHPETKVVYMSGHVHDEDTLRRVQAHGQFLQKPFAPSALARKVRELLAEAR